MKKTAEKTETVETVINVKGLWSNYNKAFNAEVKATNKTSLAIDEIEKTGLTTSAFFAKLWDDGVKVPTKWPLNADGQPLAPSSKVTKDMLPNVRRLVNAIDNRKSRAAKKAKLEAAEKQLDEITGNVPVTVVPDSEKPDSEKPATVEKVESAPRVESSDSDLTFDSVTLIESLQGFMIALSSGALELDEKDAKLAHKLSKQLVTLAQKA